MCPLFVLFGALLSGLAQAGASEAGARPWGVGGWHASLATPGDGQDAYGYDLGLSHRGRRGSMDVELAREIYPQLDSGAMSAMRIDAQSTARLAGGLLLDAQDGGFHHLELGVDRQSWLDLEQSFSSAAYDHRVAQSLGLRGRYGRASSPTRPVRTSVYVGAGLRQSLAVRSAHDGSLFDWASPEDKEVPAVPEQDLLESPSDGVRPPQKPRLPSLDLGRHRAELQAGFSMSAQARVEVDLWADQVAGRVDSSVELQQLDTGSLTVGPTIGGEHGRYTAISSHTRLSARFVGWERAVVPSLFVDLSSLRVVGASPGPAMLPAYGFSLSRGGS